MKGVVYVALGHKALQEAEESYKSYREHNRFPVKVLKKPLEGSEGLTVDQQGHFAKVSAAWWSPYNPTLLLDADTRVNGDLSIGFNILRSGWDVVMVPSTPPKYPVGPLWSLSTKDREVTLQRLGTWNHIMLNTGVMYFTSNKRTLRLFEAWREEWLRFKDRDQGAFLRALRDNPVKLWLLGSPYNSAGGEVIDHLFGRARA